MYIVIEIQKTGETLTVVTPIHTYSNLNEAESYYYSLLSVAAVSQVERHGASLLEDTGRAIYYKTYDHGEVTNE